MEFLIGLVIGIIGMIIYYTQQNAKLIQQWKNKEKQLFDQIEEIRLRENTLRNGNTKLVTALNTLEKQIKTLTSENQRLSKYTHIADVDDEAKQIMARAQDSLTDATEQATDILAKANLDAKEITTDARNKSAAARDKTESALLAATQQAAAVIENAKIEAQRIAGDAYEALNKKAELEATAEAMRNIIEGYGNQYLKPTFSLLDELAEGYSHTDAGQQLTSARKRTQLMLSNGQAAQCDYVEDHRRSTAIAFILDAFNGKVDSILANVRSENHGKLEQQIRDAYQVVNHLGSAFRNARISDHYLAARLEELRWAATTVALREQEREEQRQIKEQIREEEKARREYERAIKESAKEEETIRKAMEKAQAAIEKATDANRAEYEAKLAELQSKLTQAEEKNQRALSMAQQTRAGHVYVISNIGSFGEEVFKVGMTRRLEPLDRVKELGDASVPFEFDVHAMMYSEDAPSLERELHRRFNLQRVNMVNFRKEFFRVDLTSIRSAVDSLIGTDLLKEPPHFTMTAAAAQYRESQTIYALPSEERNRYLADLLRLELITPTDETEDEPA